MNKEMAMLCLPPAETKAMAYDRNKTEAVKTLSAVSKYFDISESAILGKTRVKNVTKARHFFRFLCVSYLHIPASDMEKMGYGDRCNCYNSQTYVAAEIKWYGGADAINDILKIRQ